MRDRNTFSWLQPRSEGFTPTIPTRRNSSTIILSLRPTYCIVLTYMCKQALIFGEFLYLPQACPQPMKEEYLLTGELEPTNEPYAIAKIAGIKLCQSYNKQYGTNFISVMPTIFMDPTTITIR